MAQDVSIERYIQHDERKRFTAHIFGGETTEQLSQYTFLSANLVQRVALVKAAPIYQEKRISGIRLALLEVQASLNLLAMPDENFYTRYQLTNREKDVLEGVMKGLKNREIGEMLYITEITVKKHVSNILQKTDCKNRDELIKVVKNSP